MMPVTRIKKMLTIQNQGLAPGDSHMFCRQMNEQVQRRHVQPESHAERDQDDDQRLAKELSDQLPAQGADGFADAYFPRPFSPNVAVLRFIKLIQGPAPGQSPRSGKPARPSVQWFRRSFSVGRRLPDAIWPWGRAGPLGECSIPAWYWHPLNF